MYKKFILFLLILAFFIGSAYGAEDSIADPALASDDVEVNEEDVGGVVLSENDENVGDDAVSSGQNEVLATEHSFNGTTFSELQDEISVCDDNDVIYLNNDIKQTGGDSVIIDRPITIDGRGHTIDAQRKSCIFEIKADNVILTNISFINGKFEEGEGGAVICDGADCSIDNCRFENNTADDDGGAILWSGVRGQIDYCIFVNNHGDNGGAVKWDDESGSSYNAISHCIFINNRASNNGGAICWYGAYGKIEHSIFINNEGNYIIYCHPLSQNSPSADFNWFGNNASNYNEKPSVNSKVSTTCWHVLDDEGNNSFSLNNVYDSNWVIYYKVDNYQLPDVKLDLSSDDVDLLVNTVTISSSGVSDKVMYIPPGDGKSVKSSFGSAFMTIKLSDSSRDKTESKLNASDLSVGLGDEANYTLYLTDLESNPIANGNITVVFNEIEYNISTNDEGIASVKLNTTGLSAGEYDIFAKFLGNLLYNGSEINNTLTVYPKESSSIKISLIDGLKLTSVLTDANGNPIADAEVSFVRGDKTGEVKTNDDGEFTIDVVNNCVLQMTFKGNEAFYGTNSSIVLKNIVPVHKSTFIEVPSNFDRTAVDFKAGEKGSMFYVTLKDSDGNPLAGKSVKIGIFDKIYTVKTDKDGKGGLQINVANANDYTYGISFLGDDDYKACFAVSCLHVLKKPVTITPAKTSYAFKASAKTKTVTATLKTNNAYIPKGKQVTLAIAGKTFKATIGDKGQISFNIGSVTAKGTYKVAIKYAGSNTYSAATSKTITIKIS